MIHKRPTETTEDVRHETLQPEIHPWLDWQAAPSLWGVGIIHALMKLFYYYFQNKFKLHLTILVCVILGIKNCNLWIVNNLWIAKPEHKPVAFFSLEHIQAFNHFFHGSCHNDRKLFPNSKCVSLEQRLSDESDWRRLRRIKRKVRWHCS